MAKKKKKKNSVSFAVKRHNEISEEQSGCSQDVPIDSASGGRREEKPSSKEKLVLVPQALPHGGPQNK